MNPTNPQKLISTFLILATAVSSSVFIFATNENSIAVQTGNSQIAQKLPENAFADESIKQIAGFSTYNTVALKGNSSRDNLTDYFAEKLLGQLAEDNDGVSLSNSKTGTSFVLPDMKNGLDYFLKDPNVSLVASVNTKDIKTKKDSSAEDIQKYFEEITPIVETYSKDFNDQMEYYSKNVITAASFGTLDFIVSNTAAKLYNIKAPTEVADYHASIIKAIKTRSGFTGVNNDPLKSYFYAKNFEGMISIEKNIVENAAGRLGQRLSLLLNTKEQGVIAKYLAINTAHAQWITTDLGGLVQRVTQWLTSLKGVYQQILDYAIKIATEILKDQLIHKLVQQTVNWANNGFSGKPQYVENFGRLLQDAAKSAGDRVLSDAMNKFNGGACPTLKPLLEITFEGTAVEAGVGNTEGYSCTIDQMGANIEDFKNSFANGGWIAYRSMLTNPQGTYIGAAISIADKISQEQDKKTEETKQETSTGGGFLNMKQCKNKKVETGADAAQFATVAEAKSSLGDAFVSATCPAGGACTEVVWCESVNGTDQWETTTPGQVAGQAVKDAIGKSPIDRIVNANDITALVSALINAALTKLVGLGRDGIRQLTNKELEKKDGSVADICATAEDPKKCQEEIDGATKGVDEVAAKNVSENLTQMISFYSEMAAVENEINDKGGRAKFYLEQASSTCSATFLVATDPDVTDAQYYVDQNYGYVVSKIDEANEMIPKIVDGETGLITQLQNLSAAIKDKDLDTLMSFDLGITPTGDTTEKKVINFVSKLAAQMDSPGSAFSVKFSTPIELNQAVGALKTASQKIADDACSILYTAKRVSPDPNSCRLSPAKADCKAPTP
jgi:hypothetical protein